MLVFLLADCCVEMMEAMQHPEKVTVCIIKANMSVTRGVVRMLLQSCDSCSFSPVFFLCSLLPSHPEIMKFLINLKPRGLRMCVGFDELISLLDLDLQDQSDIAAFQWWRNSGIGAPAVPENLVPSGWPMSRFSFMGKIFLPEKSVDVGPCYISGDCRETGKALALPWLLFISTVAVGINLYDFLDKFYHSATQHTTIDYVFLAVVSDKKTSCCLSAMITADFPIGCFALQIAACNCAPFLGFSYLLDRRRDCHVAIRPLLASRSMGKEGIKVRVIGDPADPIYISLRAFLTTLGHLAPDLVTDAQGNAGSSSPKREARCVTVYVMENMARRDVMFGGDASVRKEKFDNRFSLFIWSGYKEKSGVIPFTDDVIGQRLMRYLVLVTGRVHRQIVAEVLLG